MSPDDTDDTRFAYPETAILNDKVHEVCSACGSICGHGCPQSEPCECDKCEDAVTEALNEPEETA